MINERKAANALAGKIVRPCDGCSGKRARWFCAADDAFLCRSCAESVHSANQLARRHERVRLESVVSPPAWLQGFNRKARTPRHKNNKSLLAHQQLEHEEEFLMNPLLLVPEIGNEEESNIVADEDEDQVPRRVPVFDPFAAELCVDDMITSEGTEIAAMGNEEGNVIFDDSGHGGTASDLDNLPEFLPSDMDLGEFAADIENLLGSGLEDSSPDTKASRVLDSKDEGDEKFSYEYKVVKVKDEQDQPEAIFDWDFNYESPITVEEMNGHGNKKEMKRNVFLRLNYEAIINAWASHGSPWTSGPRPELNPDGCWPHCMGMCCNARGRHPYVVGVGGGAGGGNAGREARVLRYKEKRRTRLFSKKIRYEVRRLNAEKRPRMKGRFVKRTSFMGTAFPYINR